MFGSKKGFVSVAFSEHKNMGDDETVSCTVGDKGINIERGLNYGLFNERQLTAGLTNLQAQYVDGRLFCRFTRPIEMFLYTKKGHAPKRHFDFTKKYFLMLAWGPMLPGSDVMLTHYELPPINYHKVSQQENRIVYGSSLPLSRQIHGTLMLIAWMLLAGLITVLPRHFRHGTFGKRLNGVKGWFQIHRIVAMAVFVTTGAGFILIFVVLKGIPEITTPHHYLGISVMSACVLQVLSGVFRPGEDSKLRRLFNFGHWALGKATHITAAVTFFYAFDQVIIPDPQRKFGHIVTSVWVAHQVVCEIGLEVYTKCRRRNMDSSNITCDSDMKTIAFSNGHPEKTTSQGGDGHPAVYTLYMVCLLILSSAALASIFIY